MMANPSGSGIPGLPTASTTASTLNYLLRPPQNGLAMSLGLPLQLNGSHHGRPGSGERIPIAAIGHTGRRVEPSAQKESMNCKSCRKKKVIGSTLLDYPSLWRFLLNLALILDYFIFYFILLYFIFFYSPSTSNPQQWQNWL